MEEGNCYTLLKYCKNKLRKYSHASYVTHLCLAISTDLWYAVYKVLFYSRYKYFPNCRGGVSGFGAPQPTARRYPGDDNRHNWGAGQQLGGH